MQKTEFGLVAMLGLACCPFAQASPVASVAAVAAPVWVQRGEIKDELGRNSEINIGDNVNTGTSGLLEIQLQSGVELRVYSASAIRIMQPTHTEPGAPENAPELFIERGRVCLESPPASSTGNNFNLNVADRLLATIQQYGHICVSRREGMTSINLRAGSVQITNAIDPGMVILSQTGIEFRLDDEGSYQLLQSTQDAAIADMNTEPFIVEAITRQDSPAAESGETAPAVAVSEDLQTGEPETDASIKPAGYIYTVYLFSTRSAEVANQVNERFQQAGHKSRILVNEEDSPQRYRVAVPGFESRQAAAEFADSMRGNLGITDTWIGKDRPGLVD